MHHENMKMKVYISLLTIILLIGFIEGRNHHKRKDILAGYHDDDDYFHGQEANQADEEFPKKGELFEGDIIMDDDLRRVVLDQDSKRSADILSDVGKKKHWPNGIIPYRMDKNILPVIRRQIHKAIKILNYYTCVRYIRKRRKDKDYVFFTSNSHGCSSSVGRVGGEQQIHLARGCKLIGTVLHEMMHAMGILHEQSRPDRDKHVKIQFENLEQKHANNFRKYRWHNTDILEVQYNFYSVMHYSNKAFSRNGKETIVALSDPTLSFGQRKRLTTSDVREINKLYQCNNIEYDDSDLLEDMTDEAVIETLEDRKDYAEEISDELEEGARRFKDRFSN